MDARQDYQSFWDYTPKEVILVVNSSRKRDQRDHEEARILNYEMASLITFAHHQPKKMPKYEPLKSAQGKVSDEAQQAQARGAFIAWALANGANSNR